MNNINTKQYICPVCEGEGIIEYKKDIGYSPYDEDYYEDTCYLCNGNGYLQLTDKEKKYIESKYNTILEEY